MVPTWGQINGGRRQFAFALGGTSVACRATTHDEFLASWRSSPAPRPWRMDASNVLYDAAENGAAVMAEQASSTGSSEHSDATMSANTDRPPTRPINWALTATVFSAGSVLLCANHLRIAAKAQAS